MSNDWTHNENVRTQMACLLSPLHSLTPVCSVVLQDTSGTNHMQLRRTRRSRIPDKPNYSLNLWSIMKNCIGKDLSKIPMPVKKKASF